MGRTPCCDKVGLKKGPWTPEEDQKLLAYIEEHGHGSWRALPAKAGLQRCGKSCRLRWTNYLRPDIKRGKFSLQEEQTIIQLHALLGNRWSAIATHLPKRTDNEIKNYWNTHLKKRLAKMGIDPVTHKPKNDTLLSSDGQSKNAANISHMAQWESARLEAEARLVKQSKLRSTMINSPEFTSPIDKHVVVPPGAPQPCLGLLKGWSKRHDAGKTHGFLVGHELESPTSTVSYSENEQQIPTTGIVPPSSSTNAFIEFVGNSEPREDRIMKDEGGQHWHSESFLPSGLQCMALPVVENPWEEDDVPEHNVPSNNFIESFTDLLLSTCGGRKGGGDSDDGGTAPSDYNYEDNKNYWNNILDLVNSSPSHSSMF